MLGGVGLDGNGLQREREGGREGGRERYYDNSMAYTCMYMYMNVFILHVSIL